VGAHTITRGFKWQQGALTTGSVPAEKIMTRGVDQIDYCDITSYIVKSCTTGKNISVLTRRQSPGG